MSDFVYVLGHSFSDLESHDELIDIFGSLAGAKRSAAEKMNSWNVTMFGNPTPRNEKPRWVRRPGERIWLIVNAQRHNFYTLYIERRKVLP